MRRRLVHRTLAAAIGALALCAPTLALAAANGAGTTGSTSTTATATTATASSTASASAGTPPAGSSEGAPPAGSAEGTSGGESGTSTTATATAPEVRTQAPQHQTAAAGHRRGGGHPPAGGPGSAKPRRAPRSGSAPAPGKLGRGGLPPLPFSLRTPVFGLPGLFLEAYDVPPFLLPIYQAAGIAYGVPWQVLAAINEVESDYGHDLNVSSAGAEGWMQFLPSEWRQWGVDAGGAGYMDPYNPADAIFAAARYLSAAGGAAHIRAAVYAYNHSQAYVESVMLRAQLLGGLPPEMLGAVTDLAEARFPVHAAAHFSDGFATVSASAASAGAGAAGTIVGTTIYSQQGAPAIAVKDGTVVAIGDSPALGLHISLRDAYGDVFTYADLGEVASLYPVLAPRRLGEAARIALRRRAAAPPRGPATAGVQPHSPLSAAAVTAGFTFGAAAGLERNAAAPRPTFAAPARRRRGGARTSSFAEGPERVYLRALRPGAQVIAGTVLGHLAAGAQAHMLFQIRPGGSQSPLIDPKPLLDSWVALEDTGVFAAKGESPFLLASPTAGQALLESRGQLQAQVLRNRGIGLAPCARREVEAGRIDRRVLATLELLSVSGLRPTATRLRCGDVKDARDGLREYAGGESVDIAAVNGVPIAGHAGPGGVADLLERRLLSLQGTIRPQQIAGPVTYPDAREPVSLPASRALVHLAFAPTGGRLGVAARLAGVGAALAGSQWTALDERLAEISDPQVSQSPSAASVPDGPGPPAREGGR